MADISDWSATAANNNATSPDGFAEGMAPSGVNDSAREVMAAIRRWYADAQWIDLGFTHTRTGSSTFTLPGDYTGTYQVGRRVKFTGSADAYATISASSYSAPDTTVEVSEGNVPATLSTVSLSILTPSNGSIPVPLTLTPSATTSPALRLDGRIAWVDDSTLYRAISHESAAGPDVRAKWNSGSTDRYLAIGVTDNVGTFTENYRYLDSGELQFSSSTAGIAYSVNAAVTTPLTGGSAGPELRARWDSGTTDRYLKIGQIDNLGAFTEHLRSDDNGVRFIPTTAPASPSAGHVYYDSGTNKLRCYNGSGWQDLF